jgi:glycosyltransferase involved in cell wall biosynthesis
MHTANEQAPVILYFGNDWFAENRTSSHQIARRLARHYRVYYVECPGLRAPKGSGRDLKKIWGKLVRFLRGVRPVEEWLKVCTLLQVPLHRFALVRRLNQLLILWTLRWLMMREGIRDPITWFMIPHLSPVVGRLGERLSVYYCIDDYAALPDVNEAAVRAMDEEMTRKADLVFVASDTLLGAKRRLNPSTYVSPHGVDFDHFARAQDGRLEPPPEVAQLPRPVVGFFGLIERWIDLDLVRYLAEQRPHWAFVMIGRVAVPDGEVPRRENIHYLGKRPYDLLPAYGKQFDAAIIPYRLTQQVLHANPIKLREYLAMGKPVVSVSTPEIDKYADLVEISHSREQFLANLDAVVARPASPEEVRKRMGRVAHESWEGRLRQVLETIHRRLGAATSLAGCRPGTPSARGPPGRQGPVRDPSTRPAVQVSGQACGDCADIQTT